MKPSLQRTTVITGLLLVSAGLAGLGCGGGGNIVVDDGKVTLTVSGTGNGRIKATDNTIDCKITASAASGTCSNKYTKGVSITLEATADANNEFSAWAGGCTGASTCTLTISGNVIASAQFVQGGATLSLEFTTPRTDDGGAIIRIDGPSILTIVPTAGIELVARPAGAATATSKTILVRGNLTSGAIARVGVRSADVNSNYTATVQSVAARQSGGYAQRNTSGYNATLRP